MDESHTIWIEKYRPAKLADIVGQDEIVERLQSYVKAGSLPHLLFTGTAGGKDHGSSRSRPGILWRSLAHELQGAECV